RPGSRPDGAGEVACRRAVLSNPHFSAPRRVWKTTPARVGAGAPVRGAEIAALNRSNCLPNAEVERRAQAPSQHHSSAVTVTADCIKIRTFVTPPDSLPAQSRSEEHTSELQLRVDLVCCLLLDQKITRAHLSTL